MHWPWSPWENIDPAIQRSYSGAASGKGAAGLSLGIRPEGVIVAHQPGDGFVIRSTERAE